MTASERFEVPLAPGMQLNTRERDSAVCIAGFINQRTLVGTFGPVSYTHLDVYKRQLHHDYRGLSRQPARNARAMQCCSGSGSACGTGLPARAGLRRSPVVCMDRCCRSRWRFLICINVRVLAWDHDADGNRLAAASGAVRAISGEPHEQDHESRRGTRLRAAAGH